MYREPQEDEVDADLKKRKEQHAINLKEESELRKHLIYFCVKHNLKTMYGFDDAGIYFTTKDDRKLSIGPIDLEEWDREES